MQLAVADGPNHWPGCFPQAVAPCWTNRWIENGALGSSANRDMIFASSMSCFLFFFLRQSRPWCSMIRALASRLCPERIIQPQPLSLLKPSRSARLRSRTAKVIEEVALGSWERGIGGKFDLYVIHILDSKSSRKRDGQPPSAHSLSSDGTSPSTIDASSKLLLVGGTEAGDSGLVDTVEAVVSEGGLEVTDGDAISTMSPWSVVETTLGGGEMYSRPRHQIGIPLWSLYLGCGS